MVHCRYHQGENRESQNVDAEFLKPLPKLLKYLRDCCSAGRATSLLVLRAISCVLLKTMSSLSSERSLIPQPLSVLLDAANLFTVVIWHWVLYRLTSRIHPVSLDMFVEVVILLCDLLGVAAMKQTPN